MDKGKDRARAKELFRQMTPGEKIDHIWTYYCWHIIAAIAGIVALIMLINAIYHNHVHRNDLYVAVQKDYSVALMPILEHVAGTGGWDEEINYTTVGSAKEFMGDGATQIMVQLAANEMDVIICDRYGKEFIEEDPEAVGAVYRLEDTALGMYAQTDTKLYVLFLTGPRQEKTDRFEQLLLAAP